MTTDIVLMDEKEARAKTEQIRRHSVEMRRLLLEMYEREGWRTLGYESWREYGQAEFGWSETRVYELMNAAKVQRNISANAEKSIPEAHLRPLSSLTPDEQRDAYQRAVDTAPNGKVTGAHVKRVVTEYTAPSQPYRPEQVLNHPAQKSTPHVSHNSGNNEWYTPPEYIEAARQVLGDIDLDPASSEIANRTVKAGVIFTADMDGLQQDWFGRVWMNPPYSQPLINEFSQKLVDSVTGGDVDEAIVLVNNATETRWFQAMLRESRAICLIEGRIKFLDENGNPSGAPLQGQAILYLGRSLMEFHDAFERFGAVLYV